ncbi:MAG: hypothetical protein HY017_19760 [Betaproteobacteria bacterium]|nr:hypothetical protein [Betaproteobacteria bacterium]
MVKWVIFLLLILWCGVARAQGADVGLVNMVSGDVTFAPLTGTPGKVQAFMKLRDGDRINVAAGGQVRVVFFQGARQERWAGPASFRAGKKGAEPVSGKPADVSNLPAGVAQRIARVPELMQYAKLGGIQVRGGITPAQKASLEQQAAVSEARATYEKMRKESAADDITPELFLYSALHEYLLYDDMRTLVDEMLRKQPDSEDVKVLAAWVRTRASR